MWDVKGLSFFCAGCPSAQDRQLADLAYIHDMDAITAIYDGDTLSHRKKHLFWMTDGDDFTVGANLERHKGFSMQGSFDAREFHTDKLCIVPADSSD